MKDFDGKELNVRDRVAFIAAGEWSGKLHHGKVIGFSDKRVRIEHGKGQASYAPYNLVKLQS